MLYSVVFSVCFVVGLLQLEGAREEASKWFISSIKLAHILGRRMGSDARNWLTGLRAQLEEREAPDPPIDSKWTSLEP
jgi:hypothetical protein